VWLARLLLELAQERSLEGVLRKAIDAAAAVPGVALARVYLLAPGDICPTCPQQSVCPDQTLLFSLRENAIAKEPQASYPERWWCVSRLGASMVAQTPASLPRM
jgi:hypothetical protein